MKKNIRIATALVFIVLASCSGQKSVNITLIETTDIHGALWPYDYIEKQETDASLASVAAYVSQLRQNGTNLVLLDNGDNIQGQPSVYYYNYIDTVSTHLISRIFNFMKYDAATVGNHDIEAGHSVYDRLVNEYNFPLLAANAVSTATGEPYFRPWVMIRKAGLKIAVLGLITPAVPTWLPEELYRGISFADMTETALKWMPEIQKEHPDIIVGLFHSGWDRSRGGRGNEPMNENGSVSVAYNVPGFDIIFNGHDHRTVSEWFVNSAGDSVLILNGGSRAQSMAKADVQVVRGRKNRKPALKISGEILNVPDYKPDKLYIDSFRGGHDTIAAYVDRVIGNSMSTVTSRDSYFGPSAFTGLIHDIQLRITGADISFAAPLSFDVMISKGPITVSDMFKLYRFENMLYTMELSGEEIQKYLEFSYGGWVNTMKIPDDPLLRFRTGNDGRIVITEGKAWLRNQPYNFDSAAGIEYTVDVTKPEGERISIKAFSDGRPFDRVKKYKVAVNSYRGNGGGGHFTQGAGIDPAELKGRVVKSTDRDLRYYIMKSIEEQGTIDPKSGTNWKFIPEKWASKAREREYNLLFGPSGN